MSDGDPLELVSDIAGELGAATACADVVERHLALTLAIDAARLERVPNGQFAELLRAAGHLQNAGLRVLSSLNPTVRCAAQDMVEVARSEGELTVRRASEDGAYLRLRPLRSV